MALRKIPFVGSAYKARSREASCQRAVNFYIEKTKDLARAPKVLYGTPGLRRVFTLPTGPSRFGGVQDLGVGSFLAGGGDTVYRVVGNVPTSVGTLSSSSGPCRIAWDGAQALLVDGVSGYVYTRSTDLCAPIEDEDFPAGVTLAFYEDTYFIVSGDGSGRFYISANLDAKTWSGLDYAAAEAEDTVLVAAFPIHDELWLFTQKTIEIWVDTGNPSFPYQKAGNTVVEHGCAAPHSICKIDNTVMWVGRDDTGIGPVWKANGYTAVRVSDPPLDTEVGKYGDVSDAQAFAYQQGGHLFYLLNFPNADRTWCFDVKEEEWHERSWLEPGSGEERRWRGNAFLAVNSLLLVGDWEDGRFYVLDLDWPFDDTDLIQSRRVTETLESSLAKVFYLGIQVDIQTGNPLPDGDNSVPKARLRWSDDGGATWKSWRYLSVGKAGRYLARAQTRACGSGRNRVWDFTITAPVQRALLGALMDVEVGTW